MYVRSMVLAMDMQNIICLFPRSNIVYTDFYHGAGHNIPHICKMLFPLVSPMLASIKKKRTASNIDKIVFVGAGPPAFANRLDLAPNAIGCIRYRRAKYDLIRNLDVKPREKLLYRPEYNAPDQFDDIAYLRQKLGYMEELEGDLDPVLLGCKLCIMDNPGTTLAIAFAFAANVPTVCTWNINDWCMCDKGMQRISEMRDCGMFHDTASSAALHVNAIWEDVDSWWLSEPVQMARKNWMRKNALIKPNWPLSWLYALWKLNRLPRYVVPNASFVPSIMDIEARGKK